MKGGTHPTGMLSCFFDDCMSFTARISCLGDIHLIPFNLTTQT